MAGTPSTIPGCSKPRPTWPCTFPGIQGHPQLLRQPVPGSQHPYSKKICLLISNLKVPSLDLYPLYSLSCHYGSWQRVPVQLPCSPFRSWKVLWGPHTTVSSPDQSPPDKAPWDGRKGFYLHGAPLPWTPGAASTTRGAAAVGRGFFVRSLYMICVTSDPFHGELLSLPKALDKCHFFTFVPAV